MAESATIERFLLGEGPVLDVRAPAEFSQGHIPGAHNLPLFSDAERATVGTTYKQVGRQAAVQRGLELVGPKLASLGAALQDIAEAAQGSPLRLHCWRGGMRSASIAWLAGTLGLPVLLLEGGYKAYRRWVLASLEQPWPVHLLGGRTGSGKTDLLLALQKQGVAVLDLEGLAHHRGSSFGNLGLPPQPSNEHYENRIAAVLHQQRSATQIWVEAESVQVGRCRVPAGLWRQMQQAPLLEIRRPLEERLRQLVAVYGVQDPEELAEATRRIARRLGPQRTAAALEAIACRDWGAACRQMLDYYDRCYDHELQRHGDADQQRLLGRVDLGESTAELAASRLIAEARIRPLPTGAPAGPL
jgi:tRNA 2-selenouridine synthase